MKKKMIIFLALIVVLFAALYFVTKYKNDQAIEKSDNPYGKTSLKQETIDQLDDPLYQNQIIPTDLDEKLENKEDVTVYFYSPVCSHCQETTPILIPVTEEMNIDMKKVNLWEFEHEDYWSRYKIESTPTLVHYKAGKEVGRLNGTKTAAEFKAFFKKYDVSK